MEQEYNIETKVDSYDETLYRVTPPKGRKVTPVGWFKTPEEAIMAYEQYQK